MKRNKNPSFLVKSVGTSSFDSFVFRFVKGRSGFSQCHLTFKTLPIELSLHIPDNLAVIHQKDGLIKIFNHLDQTFSKFDVPASVSRLECIDFTLPSDVRDQNSIISSLVVCLKQALDKSKIVALMYDKQGLSIRGTPEQIHVSYRQQSHKARELFSVKANIEGLTNNDLVGIAELLLDALDRNAFEVRFSFKNKINLSVTVDGKITSSDLPKIIFESLKAENDKFRQVKSKENLFNRLIAQRPFHEMYERNEDRKITILCAPTNSGKTYHGTQIIKEALRESEQADCVMLFPLRVLALQIQQDIIESGIPCSMITGEEQDIDPHASVDAMTVEIYDTDRTFDTVFLDEGQLAFAKERSSGYLKVICGAKCRHLVISCAPAALQQMEWYLRDILCVNYEIKFLERLTPLEPIRFPVKYSEIENGDLIVAFSRKSIHELADRLSSAGLSVGTMYGALSPSARRAMLNQYRNNGYDVLVATDAIGMGVSAPAKRVLFAETQKFDGKLVRELMPEEYRQIAGRAGRYGYAEFGQAGVLEGLDPTTLNKLLTTTPEPLPVPDELFVIPDKVHLLSAEEIGLERAMVLWINAIKSNPLYKASMDEMDEFFEKGRWLDQQVLLKAVTFNEAVRLLYVTFPMGGAQSKLHLWKEWVAGAAEGKTYPPPMLKPGKDLRNLEDLSADITLMIQLSRIFPLAFPKTDILNRHQSQLGELIASLLEKKYAS